MAPKKPDQAKLDKLADLLREVPPEQLREILRKDEVIRLRVSKRVKADIEAEAERRGVSASSYLLDLHDKEMRRRES